MRTIALTLTALVMTLSIAVAQAPAGGGQGHGKHDKGQMVEQLKADLDLSDEQVEKLKVLHEKHMTERQEFKEESQGYKEKRKAMQEKHLAEMKEILTEEQYNKFLELKAERKQNLHGEDQGKQQHDCSKSCDHKH